MHKSISSEGLQFLKNVMDLTNASKVIYPRWKVTLRAHALLKLICLESIGRRYILHGLIQFFYDSFLSCGTCFTLVANEDKMRRKEYFYMSKLPLNFLWHAQLYIFFQSGSLLSQSQSSRKKMKWQKYHGSLLPHSPLLLQ